MSAPLAGKFQDHYEVLGVDHKADRETIRAAYEKLCKLYDKDKEKTEALELAWEVLSDPDLRKDFNKLKGIAEEAPKFSGLRFFESVDREVSIRMAVLCILYDRRRTSVYTPSIPYRLLEQMVAATGDEIVFALWYLKQKSLVNSDDKSSLQITVTGMDYIETRKPPPEVVMPMIRVTALAEAPRPAAAPQVAASGSGVSAASTTKGAGLVDMLRRMGTEGARG